LCGLCRLRGGFFRLAGFRLGVLYAALQRLDAALVGLLQLPDFLAQLSELRVLRARRNGRATRHGHRNGGHQRSMHGSLLE
jgi:hypothetical protein